MPDPSCYSMSMLIAATDINILKLQLSFITHFPVAGLPCMQHRRFQVSSLVLEHYPISHNLAWSRGGSLRSNVLEEQINLVLVSAATVFILECGSVTESPCYLGQNAVIHVASQPLALCPFVMPFSRSTAALLVSCLRKLCRAVRCTIDCNGFHQKSSLTHATVTLPIGSHGDRPSLSHQLLDESSALASVTRRPSPTVNARHSAPWVITTLLPAPVIKRAEKQIGLRPRAVGFSLRVLRSIPACPPNLHCTLTSSSLTFQHIRPLILK